MATDLKPNAKEIITQFTDLFYGKYMAELWDIQVGYSTLPAYWVTSQYQLLRWQQTMDCDNEFCAASRDMPITVVSLASGTEECHLDQPCCYQETRFKPL